MSFEIVKLIADQADEPDFAFVKQLMEGTPKELSHGADGAGKTDEAGGADEEAEPSSPVPIYVENGSDSSEFD